MERESTERVSLVQEVGKQGGQTLKPDVTSPLQYVRAETPCGCGNTWVLDTWSRRECGNGHQLPKPPPRPVTWDTEPEPWTPRFTYERPSCGWFRHDWDAGDSTHGGGCEHYSLLYTCRRCGKTKTRGGA